MLTGQNLSNMHGAGRFALAMQPGVDVHQAG
jgi:hypothetical protein